MKRKIIFGAAVAALICVCIALNAKILEPGDFTGTWYRAGDGAACIFEDGVIRCADQETTVVDSTVFSGAYSFARDKAAIFVVDDQCAWEVVELRLIHKTGGDVLAEHKDGENVVWFTRNPDASE